jgi:pimeloyl-ACP methyl ester carboxylesterase/DNA-binding CsgD family transcriptional regulator
MEQQIGFLRVAGSRVAYATMGSGLPLVFPPPSVGHLDLELDHEPMRAFYEALASRFMLVRYDRLGTGLSDRDRPSETLTLEFEVDVLDALFDELELGRARLFGFAFGAVVAAAFAARRPERVKRLLLFGAYAEAAPLSTPGLLDGVTAVLRADWELGSRLLAEAFLPDADRRLASAWARLRRESATADVVASLLELWARTDLRDVLGDITAPTLVLHRRDDEVVPVKLGRELAALIPGAEFQALDGPSHQPWFGDVDDVLSAAGAFLGFTPPVRAESELDNVVAPTLTTREREVLRLVADGHNDDSIARRLSLSVHTIHRHMANIRTRLRQPSRAAAVALAARHGLI